MSTSNLGLGLCPCGSSIAGFGQPATSPPVTAALLALANGQGQGDCAAIDPVTQDFVLDANGNKLGMSSLDQMVYLALFTTLGSCIVADQGIDWPTGVIRDNVIQQNKIAVQNALAPLIKQGLLTLVAVKTTRTGPNSLLRQVYWKPVGSAQLAPHVTSI